MKAFLDYSIRTGFVPAGIGLALGLLVISDFYSTNYLVSIFGYRKLFKTVPFEFSMILLVLLLLMVSASYVLSRNFTRAIEKPDRIFIVLLITGLHTVGIFQGMIDSGDVFFAIFFSFWIIRILTTKEYEIVGSKLNALNLILFTCAILPSMHAGFNILFSMMPLVKAMITAFLIIDIIRSKESIVFFIKTLFVITTISAIIGIIQEIVFLINGTILFPFPEKFLFRVIETNSYGIFLRVPAFTGMHLFLGSYLTFGILIGLNVFLYLNSVINRREKLFILIALIIMTAALILTLSKTIMIGLFMGIIVSLSIKWSSRFIHFIAIVLLLVAVVHMLGYWEIIIKYLILDMEVGDIALRIELIKESINGFLDKHSVIGVGIGKGNTYTDNILGWPVHNAFILAAVESGIFGFIAFCSIYIYVFLRLILTIPRTQEPEKKTILKILLASLLAYFINIQFQPDFTSYFNWILLGFIECTVIVFSNDSKKKLIEESAI
jgi:hypothetical protein